MNVWPSYRQELWPNLGKFSTRLRFKVANRIFVKVVRITLDLPLLSSFHALRQITQLLILN